MKSWNYDSEELNDIRQLMGTLCDYTAEDEVEC
jgi:hypothetical protein